MVLTTKEASYIIVLGIVISLLPISSTDIPIVQGITPLESTHMIDISHIEYSSLQYLSSRIIYNDMWYSPNTCALILLDSFYISDKQPQILIKHSMI